MTVTPEQLRLLPQPHRNHYLFSDYYLDRRIAESPAWQGAMTVEKTVRVEGK